MNILREGDEGRMRMEGDGGMWMEGNEGGGR